MNALLRTKLISLNIGPYTFNPGIVPTVVTLFFAYVMISAGQWQFDKAQYKDNLKEKIAERKNLPAVSLDEIPRDTEDRLYLPVMAHGKYDRDKYFLLDNRILHGRVGYDIYSPLLLGDGITVLVNRGFVPQGKTRDDLPEVITPAEPLLIRGLLDKIPSKAFVLDENANAFKSWPMVLQYMDIEEIKTMLGKPVFEMIIRLDEKDDFGYIREIPALKLDSAMNYGYTFQWYAMTLALIIIYCVVNTKRRKPS